MPGTLSGAPTADLDGLDTYAQGLPISNSVAYGTVFQRGHAITDDMHALSKVAGAVTDTATWATGRPTIAPPQISSEEANARYGLEGYLRFNNTVGEGDAAWQSVQAHRKQFDQTVLSATNPNPLLMLGAGLAGGVLNPVNAALAIGTGGFGEFAMGASGLRTAGEAALTASRVGRIANTVKNVVGESAFAQVPFVGFNAATAAINGQDYTGPDALRDIAIGAVLHTATHFGVKALGVGGKGAPEATAEFSPVAPPDPGAAAQAAEFHPSFDETPLDLKGATRPDPSAVPSVPDAVADLPVQSRLGAWVKALYDMADDRPVDVAQYVERERAVPGFDPEREPMNAPQMPSWREIADDTVTTPHGTSVPVRYGLVELSDLTTPHTDDGGPVATYPQELRPRGAVPEVEHDPKALLADASTAKGAPIVGPDGVVEAHGEAITALRRSAAQGGDLYARYRAELAAQHVPTDGMRQPVVVRLRAQPMADAARANLAREMVAPPPPRPTPPEAHPGPAEIDPARQMLANLEGQFARGDAGDPELMRAPGKPEGPPKAAEAPAASDGGEGEGKAGAARMIASDPELKDLAATTAKLAADHGIEVAPPEGAADPENIAKATEALAQCLIAAADEVL
jgi:hypothetical protein